MAMVGFGNNRRWVTRVGDDLVVRHRHETGRYVEILSVSMTAVLPSSVQRQRRDMEAVAVISIISVLAWFMFGAVRNSVNLNNYSEEDLKKKD